VDHLTKTGDLQRFLDESSLRDITPYVHPDNIKTAIARLEEQGERKDAQYDEVGNNKLRTDLMYLKSMLNNKDFSGLREFNENMKKSYAWDPQDYQTINSPAMRDWNFATNDSAGNKILVNSDIRVHPEYADYLKSRLGLDESAVQKLPGGKALLGAGTKLKETLLSLSPFHAAQIMLRGIMTGVNPFTLEGPDILGGEKVDPSDPNSPSIIKKVVEQGGTTGVDYRALQSHSEGVSEGLSSHGGLLKYIPGVGKPLANAMTWYSDLLFHRLIPAIKQTAMEKLFHDYQDKYPEWSTDKIARAVARHSSETFGGINFREMGRNASSQDLFRALALAPDWLESELRSGARLFNKDEGAIGRGQVLKMALGLWGIARVLNYITTGSGQYQAPFSLVHKTPEGKEIDYSIRTLPTDLLRAISQPASFVKGRLSPLIGAATEATTGRDKFGRKMQPEDLWVDIFRNFAPIPVQSVGQVITNTGSEVGNPGQLWKGVGGTAETYQTPAQKMAAELAANHTEDGPIDPTQMARHRAIMGFEDKLRAREMTMPQIYQMYAAGQLHEDDLKKITENVKKTKDFTPDMASLYTRASRLPAPEYLNLLQQMNPSEKTALLPLTQQVRKRYIAKAMKTLRPEERLKDPTFVQFLNMIPDQSPF